MTQTFNMTTHQHGSRVLSGWIAGREGAAERAPACWRWAKTR